MAAMAHRFLDNLALFDYIYHFIAIEKGDFPCLKFPEGPKKAFFQMIASPCHRRQSPAAEASFPTSNGLSVAQWSGA